MLIMKRKHYCIPEGDTLLLYLENFCQEEEICGEEGQWHQIFRMMTVRIVRTAMEVRKSSLTKRFGCGSGNIKEHGKREGDGIGNCRMLLIGVEEGVRGGK